ncbi:MAG: PAS domain-containing sensor histidine kinase [Solirubrobacterales bacterium]|nr:PAS domain-containing sensor histidine kinase [Solirubrobacterales bacterium]
MDSALPDDREFFAAVLEALTTGVIVTDDRFVVRWFNRTASECFPEVIVGRSLYELMEPFAHEQKIDRLLLRRERITTALGADRAPVEWLRGRRRMADGEHLILVWPAELTDEMNERRASFTMAAFHELRTPLTALVGFSEMLELQSAGMTPEQREAAAMIGRTAHQLAALTEDIFDLAKNSYGELRLGLATVDLADLVGDLVETHRERAAESGDELRFTADPDLPPVEIDPGRIRQVVNNLLDNALIHTPDGAVIEVEVARAGEGIEIRIEDDGDGLGFTDPREAFRTFKRAENAVAGGRDGSGIGLPLAKRLIELHRGRITLESEPENGTTARIWLPLDRAETLELGEPGPA